MKLSRSRISLRISRAISVSWRLSAGAAKNSSASLTDIAVTSADRFAVEADEQAFLLEPGAVAGRARPHVHVPLQHLAHALRFGLADSAGPAIPARPRTDARSRGAARRADRRIRSLRSPEPLRIALRTFAGIALPWLIEAEPVMLRQRLQHRLHVILRRPWSDRAVGQRQFLVLHHQLGIEVHRRADPGAGRARAVRAVEGKHPRRDLGIRDAAFDAGEALAEVDRRSVLAVRRARSILSRSCPYLKATSSESARRFSIPRRIARRSTTTSIVWRWFLLSLISSASSTHLAVDLDPHEARRGADRAAPCGTRPCGRARSARARAGASPRATP